jgi:hypothetical protein
VTCGTANCFCIATGISPRIPRNSQFLPAPSLVVRMGKSPILAGADEYMARPQQEADGPEPGWANPILETGLLPEEKVTI